MSGMGSGNIVAEPAMEPDMEPDMEPGYGHGGARIVPPVPKQTRMSTLWKRDDDGGNGAAVGGHHGRELASRFDDDVMSASRFGGRHRQTHSMDQKGASARPGQGSGPSWRRG